MQSYNVHETLCLDCENKGLCSSGLCPGRGKYNHNANMYLILENHLLYFLMMKSELSSPKL